MKGDKYKPLIGTTVGYLKILSLEYRGDVAYFNCRCICGELVRPHVSNVLKPNHTTSCGCYKYGILPIINTKHSGFGTKEYSTWQGVKDRCLNENSKSYPRYGGRGIKICDRWVNSFESFLQDVGMAPSKKHTLDRKENDGNYEPGNCRWATSKQQANNTSQNRLIVYNSKTLTLSQWCDELKVSYDMVHRRLSLGWPADLALTLKKFTKLKQYEQAQI